MDIAVPSRPRTRGRRLSLLGRLHDAEDDHDAAWRTQMAGADTGLLDAEKTRWCELGAAVAALARSVRATCVASAFCGARPDVEHVTARLSEAIDDQFDPEAWRLADAAARLAALDGPP